MKTAIKNMAAQHRVARRSLPTGPVTAAYERKVDAGEVRRDDAQVALAAKLDALHESLTSLPPVPVRFGIRVIRFSLTVREGIDFVL